MPIRGGDQLVAKLRGIADKVRKANTVQVGFLEGATYPDGTSVAMVAAINEFGRPSVGQPPRPFFRRMIAKDSAQWPIKLGRTLIAADYDSARALALMGEGITKQLRQSIIDLTDPALAKSTEAAKGFSKPLVDTGHMLRSVSYDIKV